MRCEVVVSSTASQANSSHCPRRSTWPVPFAARRTMAKRSASQRSIRSTSRGFVTPGARVPAQLGHYVVGVAGLYLLVTGGVWRGDDRFSPVDDAALRAAIETQATPFCVCAECRVVLPYEVSVGRCPRCNSKSNCVEVFNFSDRKLALDLATLEPSVDFELRPLRAE